MKKKETYIKKYETYIHKNQLYKYDKYIIDK